MKCNFASTKVFFFRTFILQPCDDHFTQCVLFLAVFDEAVLIHLTSLFFLFDGVFCILYLSCLIKDCAGCSLLTVVAFSSPDNVLQLSLLFVLGWV